MSKILVIEDDPNIVELLQVMLSELGHRVIAASEVDQALALAEHEKPDLITLDFHLPAADGIEIRRLLRGIEGIAKTPIIFISGGDPGEIITQMPTDPRVSFIAKPIDTDLLSRMVVELLGYQTPAPFNLPRLNDEPPA
jgi:CheY-like chemotaxis protein